MQKRTNEARRPLSVWTKRMEKRLEGASSWKVALNV